MPRYYLYSGLRSCKSERSLSLTTSRRKALNQRDPPARAKVLSRFCHHSVPWIKQCPGFGFPNPLREICTELPFFNSQQIRECKA